MDDITDPIEPEEAPSAPAPLIPAEPAPPIHSRFLFVDVAAMRAKQLRRGALSRLRDAAAEAARHENHKAERVAMEEVRRGLVLYDIPDPPSTSVKESQS